MNKPNIVSSIKFLILAMVLTIGGGYLFAWTGPTASPADDNAAAPISTTEVAQVKDGPLTVNYTNLSAVGLHVVGQIQIVDGGYGAGKVLVSDASGIGTWTTGSSGTAGGGCYTKGTTMGADNTISGATYNIWGNASTPYSSTYATPAQSTSACTCPTGYTARVTGQQMSSSVAGTAPQNTAFICFKN